MLERVEEQRRAPKPGEDKRRGRASRFTAYDFERIELLRRVLGLTSAKATWVWLTSDAGAKTRRLFCLDQPFAHDGGSRESSTGVPGTTAMSDYRRDYFPESERSRMYQLLERFMLTEKLMASPTRDYELGLLYADGSKLETHYTPPKKKNGEVINAEPRPVRDKPGHFRSPITAPDAGYVPHRGGETDHSGAGWNILLISTIKGTILARRCVPLNDSESGTLTGMVDELGEVLGQFERRIAVLTADSAFNSKALRKALYGIGVVEKIHMSSHGTVKKGTKQMREQRNDRRYRIEGHPNWTADGHRHLHCKCGKGTVVRRVTVGEDGKAIVAAQGQCRSGCGSPRIVAGKWRLAKDGFRKVRPGEQESADWTFGNPLTYNDEKAAAYGVPRYNAQEGLFGSQLSTRFKLIRNKRWFRRQEQVEMEVSMVICITHALSLECHRRMDAAAPTPLTPPGAAPPLALAA